MRRSLIHTCFFFKGKILVLGKKYLRHWGSRKPHINFSRKSWFTVVTIESLQSEFVSTSIFLCVAFRLVPGLSRFLILLFLADLTSLETLTCMWVLVNPGHKPKAWSFRASIWPYHLPIFVYQMNWFMLYKILVLHPQSN